VSSLCLAHHAVRLWRSPRRWPRGATNPAQICWKSHVAFPLSEGRWPSLIRQNRSHAISCVTSVAPSACRVIADKYSKCLHFTVRLKVRLYGRSAICHMPYSQHICHIHKKYAISTTQMPYLQHLCHICNTYAISATLALSSRCDLRVQVSKDERWRDASLKNTQYTLYSQRKKCVYCVHAHKGIWHDITAYIARPRSDPIPKKKKSEWTHHTYRVFGYES